MKILTLAVLMTFSCNCFSYHEYIKDIYIDGSKNVHIIYPGGTDKRISHNGRAITASLAPDKRTAAWLVLNNWIAEGDVAAGASQLAVFRDGKLRYITCEPFIRAYWFWMQGEQVALDCGGRHFSGTQFLYDTATLTLIESFLQSDVPENKRPVWSR